MTSKHEVDQFLIEFKIKMKVFGILFLDDRGKNQQTLFDLEITPIMRREIIGSLQTEDHVEGPLEEKMRGILPMWVFGKKVKSMEIYIKISMGNKNSPALCISFHVAEHGLIYPFKNSDQ